MGVDTTMTAPVTDTQKITETEIVRLRALAEAATPGPWRAEDAYGNPGGEAVRIPVNPYTTAAAWTGSSENAAFIAAASPQVVIALLDALKGRGEPAAEEWEYVPGHRWVDRNGDEQWFVGTGVIAPGYVEDYLAEGGEVIRRKVGPWEPVSQKKGQDQ